MCITTGSQTESRPLFFCLILYGTISCAFSFPCSKTNSAKKLKHVLHIIQKSCVCNGRNQFLSVLHHLLIKENPASCLRVFYFRGSSRISTDPSLHTESLLTSALDGPTWTDWGDRYSRLTSHRTSQEHSPHLLGTYEAHIDCTAKSFLWQR